jgi:hypothetical protein
MSSFLNQLLRLDRTFFPNIKASVNESSSDRC